MWSIIIASYNGADTLPSVLVALNKEIENFLDVEVILVNNCSTDETEKIIAEQAERDSRFSYLCEDRKGKSYALNSALKLAKGEWIAFLDDDIVVETSWFSALTSAAEKYPNAKVLCGQIRPHWIGSAEPWCEILAGEGRAFGCSPSGQAEGPIHHSQAKGGNMAILRSALRDQKFDIKQSNFGNDGGADVGGEDTGLVRRIAPNPGEVLAIPGACARHIVQEHEYSKRGVFSRQQRIGRSIAVREEGSFAQLLKASAKCLFFSIGYGVGSAIHNQRVIGRCLNGVAINSGRLDYHFRAR